MEENKNQQPQGLQIELKPEIGVGVYANLALITHSSSDFILDFTCMLPGMQQPQVRSRGKINLPEAQQPRTATPFNNPEA